MLNFMYDVTQSSFVDSFHEGGRFISEALIMESHKLGGLKQSVNFFAHSLEARSLESTLPVLTLSGGGSDQASPWHGDTWSNLSSLSNGSVQPSPY